MAIKATAFRQNLYRVLDEVLETGAPVEILRRGKILRLVPAPQKGKMERLVPRPEVITGDPDDLIHCDWSDAWNP
jgi:antitoxin (DNA-binding transcriptional repressor) of toxin-antitoxin stability system